MYPFFSPRFFVPSWILMLLSLFLAHDFCFQRHAHSCFVSISTCFFQSDYQNSRGWSYGVGTEVTWSRHGFNLCVAPSYGNWSVSVFWRVRKRGCPERGVERTGKLRLGAEGLQRVWFGILVNYKLEFNYLSIPAYIRKGNGDVWQSG